jgi:hypothetical protein
MAKQNNSANSNFISTQDELLEFVETLPAANSKKGKVKVKRTLTNFQSMDVTKLRSFDEDIFLSGANVEFNLKGDVGVFTAAVLSRRFKRTGFDGRSINLAIPASVSADDRAKLIDRIGKCVDTKSVDTVKSLVEKGATLTMAQAKEIGLIDQVIDLSKRRGQPKSDTAKVPPVDNTVADNEIKNA